MISIALQDFERACGERPAGYREHVLSYAKIAGDRLWLSPEDHTYLANFYRQGAPPEPRWTDNAMNLGRAMTRWISAGFPVADDATIAQRAAACRACPYWDGSARLGLGKCTHAQCGCTRLKWWLQTEKCPDGRWPN